MSPNKNRKRPRPSGGGSRRGGESGSYDPLGEFFGEIGSGDLLGEFFKREPYNNLHQGVEGVPDYDLSGGLGDGVITVLDDPLKTMMTFWIITKWQRRSTRLTRVR